MPITFFIPAFRAVVRGSGQRWRSGLALSIAALAIAGCSEKAPTKDQILSRANEAFAAQRYSQAEKDYREVLRLAADDPVAMRRLAVLYYDQGQIAQAYPLLKKYAGLQPDDAEMQVKFGLALLATGDYAQAREAVLQALAKRPGDEQALSLLADATRTSEEVEDVRKMIEDLRKADQDRPSYHLALGSLSFRKGEKAGAETEFKKALVLDPKSATAHVALAMLYWSNNDLKAADQELKTAADLAPVTSPVRLRYADFKVRTGAAAEAKAMLEDINKQLPEYLPPRVALLKIACAEQQKDDCAARVQNILAQDPANFEAVYQDALISAKKGDTSKAIRELEFLSNAFPRNALVRYQLASAYLLSAVNASEVNVRKAIESAENRVSEAVKLDPKLEPAVLLFAELKIRKGNAAAAIEPLKELIKERPQTAQSNYLLATAYLAQRQNAEAASTYQQMETLFPKDPQPSFLLGNVLLAQGQQADARKAFERAAVISPDYLPATERLIDFEMADKQYATAMGRAQQQIDKDPKRAQPWALRAKVYLAQRDFAHAEPDLAKAVEIDPKFEAASLLLTQLYIATNRQDQAIAKLNAFAEQNKSIPALVQLASIYEKDKNYTAARDAYEKLLAINGNNALALNNLAVVYSERLDQVDKALDLAKRARTNFPNNPNLTDTLGWVMYRKGDYRNALPLLQEGAANLTENPEVQYHLAMAQYMMGDEAAAKTGLQKAVQLSSAFPQKAEAQQRLAMLTIDAKTSTGDARAALDAYLQQQPRDPVALTRLARLQARDGSADQAIATYQKVIDANPLFAPALRDLALAYLARGGDDSKAFDVAAKARQAYPEDAELAKTFGILNFKRGLFPQSAELLNQAAGSRRNDADIQLYLGKSYQQLKRWDDCKSALERALAIGLPAATRTDAQTQLTACTEQGAQ
ncbi:tetratricopeptide repeat protein [Bradyrhizobium sp. McL0615]|uniref:tetratricopeptide repeat protein n=1 Tax=Bradyrhizobium sp. McL0615 TaxID=3415673 RepID=UPI003CE9146D